MNTNNRNVRLHVQQHVVLVTVMELAEGLIKNNKIIKETALAY